MNKYISSKASSFKIKDIKQSLINIQTQLKDANLEDTCVSNLAIYSTAPDDPNVVLEYYTLDKTRLKDKEDYIASAREHLISKEAPTVASRGDDIVRITIQNPLKPVDLTDNVVNLLDLLINELEKYEDTYLVSDIVFHDFINDDALSQPFINIYLAKDGQ